MDQGISQDRHGSKSLSTFQSPDPNIIYNQSTLSRMTNAYIYSPKAVFEPGTMRSAARCLKATWTLSAHAEPYKEAFHTRTLSEREY